jgi:ABC-type dipeptide/oligopeptide/nickel transport system permease subunit
MLVYSTLNISSVIAGISSMSFIGLGVRPPQAEWGATLNEARACMNTNPLALAAAVACILLAVTSFQLLGEALRDALDVRASHLGLAKPAGRNADAGRA